MFRSVATGLTAIALSGGWSARAQVISWDGDCGVIWAGGCSGGRTNWSGDTFPNLSDEVQIPGGAVVLTGPFNVANEAGSLAMVPGSSLSVGPRLVLGAGPHVLYNVAVSLEGLQSSGETTLLGDSRGGPFYGVGRFFNADDMTDVIVGTNTITGDFTNLGTVNLPGSGVTNPSSVIFNEGTWTFGGEQNVGSLSGRDGFFVNRATIRRTGTGVAAIDTNFNQEGGTTIFDGGATIMRTSSRWFAGTMTIADGASVQMGGGVGGSQGTLHTFEGLSSISGQGALSVANAENLLGGIFAPLTTNLGRMTVNGYVVDSTWTNEGLVVLGGTVAGAGLINNSGTLRVDTSANLGVGTASSGTVEAEGRITVLEGVGFLSTGTVRTLDAGTFAGPGEMVFSGNIVISRPADDQVVPIAGLLFDFGATPTFDNVQTRLNGQAKLTFRDAATLRNSLFDSRPQDIPSIEFLSGTSGTPVRLENVDFSVDDIRVSAKLDLLGDSIMRAVFRENGLGPPKRFLTAAVEGAGTLTVEGPSNWENVTIGNPAAFSFVRVDLTAPSPFDAGVHEIKGVTVNDRLAIDASSTATFVGGNAAVVNGVIDNAGVAELPTGSSISGNGFFENTGFFVTDPNFLRPDVNLPCTVSCVFNNTGVVRAAHNNQLRFLGDVAQIQDGVLVGGTWSVRPGSQIIFAEQITAIGPGATLGLSADGLGSSASFALRLLEGSLRVEEIVEVADFFENSGGRFGIAEGSRLIAREGVRLTPRFRRGGEAMIRGGEAIIAIIETSPPPLELPREDPPELDDLYPLPTLVGTPVIETALLDLNGELHPGTQGAFGDARLTGDLLIQTDGVLDIDLGPNAQADRIHVEGHLSANGTIRLRYNTNTPPQPGDAWTVVTAGTTSGAINSIDAQPAPGVRFMASVTPTGVTVTAACLADVNADGVADVFDIIEFFALFAAGDAVADLTDDDGLDVFDILAFFEAFGAGC